MKYIAVASRVWMRMLGTGSVMKFILSILGLFTFFGCGSLPVPPAHVPFDISTKGTEATLNFRITEEQQYRFMLNLYGDLQTAEFSEHTKEEKLKSRELSLKLKLVKIKKDNTETIIFDENFSNHQGISEDHGRSYSLLISKPNLPKGIYRIYITSLDNIDMYKRNNITSDFSVVQPRTK